MASAAKTGSTFTYTTNGRGERVRKAQTGLMSAATAYSYDEGGQDRAGFQFPHWCSETPRSAQ